MLVKRVDEYLTVRSQWTKNKQKAVILSSKEANRLVEIFNEDNGTIFYYGEAVVVEDDG